MTSLILQILLLFLKIKKTETSQNNKLDNLIEFIFADRKTIAILLAKNLTTNQTALDQGYHYVYPMLNVYQNIPQGNLDSVFQLEQMACLVIIKT